MSPKIGTGGKEEIISTACSSHCGGRCLLRVHLKDGIVTRIETDGGDEPQLRACLRCRAYRQRLYDPGRLKYPMKRTGERGDGRFERISWDEALDSIVAELNRIRSSYGPASVLFLGGGGDITELHRNDLIQELLAMTGGLTRRWGVPSFEGGLFASLATYGTLSSLNDTDDLLNSRLIILWGCNPAVTINETNASWYLVRAREAGCRIVTVDPRHTESAAILSHQWIPIFPGTDTAMLIAMAYVIIRENLHDRTFLDAYTIGFDRFCSYVLGAEDGIPKNPSWAEAITGTPAKAIEVLAREYATIKPAALLAGVSPGRTAYGEQFHRTAKTLAAMTGNIGIHGGWAGRSFCPSDRMGGFSFKLGSPPRSRSNPVEEGFPMRKDALSTRQGSASSARIHYSETADALLKGKEGGYPADIRMLLIMQTNPINQYPNTNKMVQGFQKMEFIGVAEQVMTATARFADILLPVNTFMERNDLTIGGAIPTCGLMKKVVEPLYESRSPLDICCGLAERLGIKDYSEKTEEEWLREMIKGSLIPYYDELREKTIYRPTFAEPNVAFRKQIEDPVMHPFPTPSGKIEIYSKRLADMENPEIPAIPKYIEAWEGRSDPLRSQYPLQLVTPHFRGRAHSQFANLPWLRELTVQTLSMNPEDATPRGIRNGDMVQVFNARGVAVVPVRVTERIMPGVVDMPQGAWYNPDKEGVDRGGCVNVLSRDRRSPAGAACTNTCLVQVQKA